MIVAIGSVIEDREWIIDRYLASLEALTVPPDYEKKYVFVMGDSVTDKTPDAIVSFLNQHDGALGVLKREKIDGQIRREDRYDFEYLSRARNVLSALAFQGLEADKLFSVDSDILVEPSGLIKLMDSGFTIAAAPVRNSSNPDVMNYMMFNDWDEESAVRFSRANLGIPSTTSPFKVDLTGACILVDSAASDLRYCDFCGGEDTGFAMDAFYEGIDLIVIPTVYTEHYMDRNNPQTPLVCTHLEPQMIVRTA